MTRFSRRDMLRTAAFGFLGSGLSGWMPALAESLRQSNRQRRCILLWMTGGPSQTDTFDMKPGHANGGEFQEIETSAPGVRFSEHLPKLARQAKHMAIIRSMSTGEGDHGRGTYLMRTGHRPEGAIHFPTLGSMISKELSTNESPLPSFVSVTPNVSFNPAAYESGFLGPRYAPLTVKQTNPQAVPADGEGFTELGVDDLQPPAGVADQQVEHRLELLRAMQEKTLERYPGGSPVAHHTVLERALRLMQSSAGKAFDLSQETAEMRERYGRGAFGQGCLLARRLIEQGVSFVEVSLGDFGRWDTHRDNFNAVRQLSGELDAGWSSLMADLDDRGLLESTTILWMGEFGRTPRINGSAGRDHYPAAWSAVLAGGGIRGGQVYGRTNTSGMSVVDDQMDVGDLLATLCKALGIDPRKQNMSGVGRPIRIADGRPVDALVH